MCIYIYVYIGVYTYIHFFSLSFFFFSFLAGWDQPKDRGRGKPIESVGRAVARPEGRRVGKKASRGGLVTEVPLKPPCQQPEGEEWGGLSS